MSRVFPEPDSKRFLRSRRKRVSNDNQLNETEMNLSNVAGGYRSKKQLTRNAALNDDYLPARYDKALQYHNERTYRLKVGDEQFVELKLLDDTKTLKYFGLGPYFYVQFQRRMVWLFFFIALLSCMVVYINVRGNGLKNYSLSFSTYLTTTSLGNFNGDVLTGWDKYIVALLPAVNLLLLIVVILVWKAHYYAQISEEQKDPKVTKPQKYCLEVECEKEKDLNTESLNAIFSHFGPIYEISLVQNYKHLLSGFAELESLEQDIKQEVHEIRLQNNNDERNLKLMKQTCDKMKDEIVMNFVKPKVISAYVHYQFEKSKLECLAHFQKLYLYNGLSDQIIRELYCCLQKPQQKLLFEGKYKLLIKNDSVPSPEDINWESHELTCCSGFCRCLIAAAAIILFLAVSCVIIGLCTIYVSTHSNDCEGVSLPSDLAAAQKISDDKIKLCYCSANVIASLSNSDIQSYCSNYLTSIYVEEAIQYAIIIVSGLTNFIFGLLVDSFINFTRPKSCSSALLTKTVFYTLFLTINTILLPILLFANIFGFEAANYVSFLTVFSSNVSSFFAVNKLQFYVDYTDVWYHNVSPIFTNYLICDTLLVWIRFILSYTCTDITQHKNEQGLILQRHMNKLITSYELQVFKEFSSFILVLAITMLFMGGIPVLTLLGFLDMLSRYLTGRYLLQKRSKQVEGLGEYFTSVTIIVMPILIILSLLNAEWMITGNSSLYPKGLDLALGSNLTNIPMLQRELYLPFYIVLAIVVLMQLIVSNMVISFCSCSREFQQITSQQRVTKPFSTYAKRMNVLTSYNIHKNDKMRNAVMSLQRYSAAASGNSDQLL